MVFSSLRLTWVKIKPFLLEKPTDPPPISSFSKKIWLVPLWILPSFQWSPLLGSQLRLIPRFVFLKIKWSPLKSSPPPAPKTINNDRSLINFVDNITNNISTSAHVLIGDYFGRRSFLALGIGKCALNRIKTFYWLKLGMRCCNGFVWKP